MADEFKITPEMVLNGAVGETATLLKTYWRSLDSSGKTPKNEEFIGKARALLNGDEISIGERNGVERKISVETLQKKEIRDELKDKIDLAPLDAITKKETRKVAADAINRGIENSQNDWLGKIIDYVMGFFTWLGGLFTGQHVSFAEAVGERQTARANGYVAKELVAIGQNNAELKSFVDKFGGEIQRNVHDKGMEYARTNKIESDPAKAEQALLASLARVTTLPPMDGPAAKEKVEKDITKLVHDKFSDPATQKDLKEQFFNYNSFISRSEPDVANATQPNIDRLEKAVSSFAIKVATDKNFKINGQYIHQFTADADLKIALKQGLTEHIKTHTFVDHKDGDKDKTFDKAGYNRVEKLADRIVNGTKDEKDGLMKGGLLPEHLSLLRRSSEMAQRDFKYDLGDRVAANTQNIQRAQEQAAAVPPFKPVASGKGAPPPAQNKTGGFSLGSN